jgi:hypothetical protein
MNADERRFSGLIKKVRKNRNISCFLL